MCFIVSKEYPNELIAKKDILAYKVLAKGNRAIFFDRKYNIESNKVLTAKNYNMPIFKLSVWGDHIDEGFHMYRIITDANFSILRSYNDKIVKCYIPKGTPYYMNDKNYVSLNLKFREHTNFIDLISKAIRYFTKD